MTAADKIQTRGGTIPIPKNRNSGSLAIEINFYKPYLMVIYDKIC